MYIGNEPNPTPQSAYRPLEAGDIRGNWGTLMLPINGDDSIDFEHLELEIDQLIHFGVNGIYSNGTAGEFYNQTEAEFDQINTMLARKCQRANLPFQIGVSHMSPIISLERLKRALPWQPGAVQVIVPDWFPPTESEIISFLKKLASVSSEIRLVLYNPPHAKIQLSPEQFGRIKDAVPQLVGVKVAAGDHEWYAKMRMYMSDLSVFVPGHTLATGIREGAHGAYSNVACLHPGLAQEWYNQMTEDLSTALEWERGIQQFMRDCILPFIAEERYSNPACDKLLAVVGNWSPVGSRMRWPYRSIPEDKAFKIRDIALRLIPPASKWIESN